MKISKRAKNKCRVMLHKTGRCERNTHYRSTCAAKALKSDFYVD